jgi:hypothetical protein
MCITFTAGNTLDIGICDPNSIVVKVLLVTLVTVTLKYLLDYDVFIILNFISKAENMSRVRIFKKLITGI